MFCTKTIRYPFKKEAELSLCPNSGRLHSVRKRILFGVAPYAAWLVLATLTGVGVPASSQISDSPPPGQLRESVLQTVDRAIGFFTTLAIRGGYVHLYDLESSQKWGEGPTDDLTIEVQPPGTPTVGMAYLRAFQVAGNREYLKAAEEAAEALILGQNDLGGWEHTIRFDQPTGHMVSFDDNQVQSAIRFLMVLDLESEHPALPGAVERALQMMLKSQFQNGAWPHRYPKQGNYHDFATFNDGGINDCISVMMDAHRHYGKPEHLASLHLAGSFLLLSQLPPPQPGWAQQYNQYLQPAWARSYEPPSVCTLVTLRNINSLLDLAAYTKDKRYLEPIPDALAWMEKVRLPSGLWPRFVELGTNHPLYYDRGRIRVNSTDDLQIERRTGYTYEPDLKEALSEASNRFHLTCQALSGGSPIASENQSKPVSEDLIREIVSAQDEQGRWVSQGALYKVETPGEIWGGEYARRDQISSKVFVERLNTLCDYLEQTR